MLVTNMCEYNTLDTTSTPQTLLLPATPACQVSWDAPEPQQHHSRPCADLNMGLGIPRPMAWAVGFPDSGHTRFAEDIILHFETSCVTFSCFNKRALKTRL